MKPINLYLVLLFWLLATTIKAQDTVRIKNITWIDLGLGIGTPLDGNMSTYGSLYSSINFIQAKTIFKLRLITSAEMQMDITKKLPYEKISSVAILIGRRFRFQTMLQHVSIGIGLTGGLKRGAFISKSNLLWGDYNYEPENFLSPSFPFELGFVNRPKKNLGFGINLFGDINNQRSYLGVSLVFTVGTPRCRGCKYITTDKNNPEVKQEILNPF